MDQSDESAWMGGPDNPPSHGNDISRKSASTQSRVVPNATTPPPFVAPAQTEDEIAEATASASVIAKRFAKSAGAIYTANVVGSVMSGMDDPEVMRHYLEQLFADCNVQQDPLKRMLFEQTTMAYHRLGSLQCNGASAKTPEAMIVYNSAAAKLLAEFRKCILTMHEMQQISLRGGTFKKIAKPHASAKSQDRQKEFVTQLGSNIDEKPVRSRINGKPKSVPNSDKKHEASSGRASESTKESGNHDRGATKTADGDSVEQTVVAIHRASHNRW